MRSDLLLGIDAGGSSTRAAMFDGSGECYGFARGGAGNPTSSGLDHAAATLRSLCADALALADTVTASASATGRAPHDIAARIAVVTVAAAGASAHANIDWLRATLAPLGITCPIYLESDILASYFAGTPSAQGYCLVAGTGAAVIRVRNGNVDQCVDGLGWLMGDHGSGFWIGRRVIGAVVDALDQRGPTTMLTEAVLASYDLTSACATPPTLGDPLPDNPVWDATYTGRDTRVQDLVNLVYAKAPVRLAHLAPLAFTCAAAGDSTATNILADATRELADTFHAAWQPQVFGPVVLAGSVATHLTDLPNVLAATVGTTLDIRSSDDGAVGAALLAFRRHGIAVTPTLHDRVSAAIRARR